MSVADSDSSLGMPFGAALVPGNGSPSAAGAIWLNGDVLACVCPECQAPMSVRLWLMMADCWRCGTSIELTEEQEQQALRLLREREKVRRPQPPAAAPIEREKARRPQPTAAAPIATAQATAAAAPATPAKVAPASTTQPKQPAPKWSSPVEETPAPLAKAPAPAPEQAKVAAPAPATPRSPARTPAPAARPQRMTAAAKPIGVRTRLHDIRSVGEVRLWATEMFKDLPSWIISLILHMILIILLGLWMIEELPTFRPLILATEMNRLDQAGDAELLNEPDFGEEFDDPGIVNATDLAAAEPLSDSPDMLEKLIPISAEPQGELFDTSLPDVLSSGPQKPGDLLAGRDPRLRSQLVEREGGTIGSEAAVARGLAWIARHQNADGSWSLHSFDHAGDCNGRCSRLGAPSDTSGTALGLLPFLGAGQTHLQGQYQQHVSKGLRWLMANQKSDGDLRGTGMGRMYAHGQAAIALCEAYALTRDEALRNPAQRSIDFIIKAQHEQGGWRYEPGQPGDMSVVGWQLMALRSAQMGYLDVPPEVLTKVDRFLNSVQTQPSRGLYGYMPGNNPTPAMTAEGLLSRQYSGWKQNNPVLKSGVKWLLENHLPRPESPNMYYWYYGTQVMHHMGGQDWHTWNYALRDLLVKMQEPEGHEAGSWTPRSDHDPTGGRLYMTSLAVCTLEVYYRHLPLYSGHAVGSATSKAADSPKAK